MPHAEPAQLRCRGTQLPVLREALSLLRGGRSPTLAIVVETEGSVYARAGTLALFDGDRHVGWISGGCLEPALFAEAARAVEEVQARSLELDTRDDSALFSGSATGCRGRQVVAFLPLGLMSGVDKVIEHWISGEASIAIGFHGTYTSIRCGNWSASCRFASDCPGGHASSSQGSLQIQPPPRALLLGAGPEAAPLLAMLTDLGWHVRCRDPRAAWRTRAGLCHDAETCHLAHTLSRDRPDAVFVMHHSFELDLQALEVLGGEPPPFVALLGPGRRRLDLFGLLPASARERLEHRLRSPMGLALGGCGPAAIALSASAELEAWRHTHLAHASNERRR